MSKNIGAQWRPAGRGFTKLEVKEIERVLREACQKAGVRPLSREELKAGK